MASSGAASSAASSLLQLTTTPGSPRAPYSETSEDTPRGAGRGAAASGNPSRPRPSCVPVLDMAHIAGPVASSGDRQAADVAQCIAAADGRLQTASTSAGVIDAQGIVAPAGGAGTLPPIRALPLPNVPPLPLHPASEAQGIVVGGAEPVQASLVSPLVAQCNGGGLDTPT